MKGGPTASLLLSVLTICVSFSPTIQEPVQAAVSADGRVSSKAKRKAKKGKGKPPSSPPMFVQVDTVSDITVIGGHGACSASTQEPALKPSPTDPAGKCTLRSAIETANGLAGGMPLVIVLRPGRYRLTSPLPELQGSIELRGLDGPFPSRKKKQVSADANDVHDADYRPGTTRQLAPIGTTIDGGLQFQLLRTAYGSKIRLQSLRLENGAAMDESSDDKRASLGGALNALGSLVVNNSVVRRCRAINGGALYTEGRATLRNSLLIENVADRCGGLIYTAGATKIDNCEVTANRCGHFDCRKIDTSGQPGAPLPSWRKAAANPNAGGFDDDDDDDDDAHEGEDATGAVAEGPSLLRAPPSADGTGGKGSPDDGATGGNKGRKKKSKLSTSDVNELEELEASVDEDLAAERRLADEAISEETRQAQLEEADEMREKARRHMTPEAMYAEGRIGVVDDAPPPPPVAPICDAERHGGTGGQLYDLACVPGRWRTGGKMPTSCVRWRATANCSADTEKNERATEKDLSCFDFVPNGASGWCECAGGHTTAHSGCEHEPFTCQQECALLRERRRRSKAKPALKPAAQLYVIGAFGSSSRMIDGFGLICSDGSRSALAGVRPLHEASAWEFVCPGWDVCADRNHTWDDVARAPLCAAWAAKGECLKNPEYMLAQCMRSCNACPPQQPPTSDGRRSAAPLGVARLDVRAGQYVDAVRFHCGVHAAEEAAEEAPAKESKESKEEAAEEAPAKESKEEAAEEAPAKESKEEAVVSEWFGGAGGRECPLACSGDGNFVDYRRGGLVEGLVVSAGSERVDRLELGRCSSDLDV